MNAHEVFEQEWKLYHEKTDKREIRGESVEVKGKRKEEWSEVKIGELRIFADITKPFLALVVDVCGSAGYKIVPLSPFSVPASEREMLVGERVLQLWNACIAAKKLVERSWVVDVVSPDDIAEIKARLAKVSPGRLTAGDSAQAQYEREFLVAGGAFQPLVKAKRAVPIFLILRLFAYSAAAMFMVAFGLYSYMYVKRATGKKARVGDCGECCFTAQGEIAGPASSLMEIDLGTLKEIGEREEEDSFDMVAKDIPLPVDPLPAPMACPPSVGVGATTKTTAARHANDVVAIISSPVKMKCMVGSRSPGASAYMDEEPLPSPPASAPENALFTTSVNTERFAEFKENEFLDPRNEPLSTFGLDVDTSSYTMMRGYVNDLKCHPPVESVRLAEYVNYFKYDYAQPTGAIPIAADCELAQCPWNAAHKLLRIGLQAKNLDEASMPPCNLTFLVDCSGSMGSNNGMPLLKNGLLQLVKKLRPIDHVSIVTYASGCEVRLASTPGSDKEAISAAIRSLNAFGSTSGGAGLQLAYAEAQRNFDKSANNRVILVTDGDFNVGISSPRELEDFIATKRDTGIFLSVIGVGMGNYQDAAMKRLANAGNGNYAFVDSPLEAKKVMVSEFGGTLFTVAKDVKVQVEFNPAAVASYRLLGYESRILKAKDFNDDKKDAGEVGAGHSMTALYEIVSPGDNADGGDSVDALKYQKTQTVESPEMFTLKMRWKKPDGDTSEKIEFAYAADQITKPEPSVDFRFASAVAEFALILENSKFKGDASLENVFERARNSKGSDDDGYRAEFIRLVELLML